MSVSRQVFSGSSPLVLGAMVSRLGKRIGRRLPFLSENLRLKDELSLLTAYSSDSVYRLRYDSMSYDYVSPAIVKLLGFTPEEMKHLNFRSLIQETKIISDGIRNVNTYKDLEAARARGDISKWQADYLIRTKDGRKVWISDISYPWFDEEGKLIGSVGTLRDITERIAAERQMQEERERLSHIDQLTSLANRTTFFDKVEEELKRIRRSHSEFSVLLIDVDHFKKINDSCGHEAGDKVLVELGEVIKGCLRETDVPARIGGEEFAVFLPDTQETSAYWVADRICAAVAKHVFYLADGHAPVKCTVSIGVAAATAEDSFTSATLYKLADTRLYIAKHTGRNQVSVDEVVRMH